ncbi:hypothetical protein YIM1627_02040 [Thermus oshimai]|jgi:hypothetical protein
MSDLLPLDLFVSRPPETIILGRIEDGKKRVWDEKRPPRPEDVQAHLEGRVLLGVPVDKVLHLDLDQTLLQDLRPLADVLRALRIPFYAGPGNTRGAKVWIFPTPVPAKEDLEKLAKDLGKLARLLLNPPQLETFPNGRSRLFLPLFGALNGEGRPLYRWDGKVESGAEEPGEPSSPGSKPTLPEKISELDSTPPPFTRVGLPFRPELADLEALRRLARAVPFLEVALQRRPEGERHYAALALLNLAHRAGVLEEAKVLLGTPRVFETWALEDSRTLEKWREEVDRLVGAAQDPEYDRKKGLPALKECGFDPKPLEGILPEVRVGDTEEWPAPAPLESLEAKLPPWYTGILPPAIEHFAIGLARQLAISPTAPAMVALGAISAILAHRGVEIYPNPNNPTHREVPVLWVVLIGPPGSGKTPTLYTATSPLHRFERDLAKENEAAEKDYERALAEWSALTKEERAREPKPQPPDPKRLVLGDATPEAIAKVLAANKGVAVILDEFKGLLQSWNREDRSQGRSLFLSSYYGAGAPVDRIIRGTTYLEKPQITLLTGIQPGPWRTVVLGAFSKSGDADGFLERITPVLMEMGPLEKEPPPLRQAVADAYHDFFRDLWEKDLPARLTPTPGAYRLWQEFRFESLRASRNKEESDPWKSYLAKRYNLAARLAGILAVAWGEVLITEDAMTKALVLLHEVLEPHIQAAWQVGEIGDLGPAYRLARRLQKGDIQTLTTRQVYTRRLAGIGTSHEAQQALRVLEGAGWVVFDRQAKRYKVNPRIRELKEGGHAD